MAQLLNSMTTIKSANYDSSCRVTITIKFADIASSSTYDLPLNDPFSGIEDEKLVLVTESGEVDVEVVAAELDMTMIHPPHARACLDM